MAIIAGRAGQSATAAEPENLRPQVLCVFAKGEGDPSRAFLHRAVCPLARLASQGERCLTKIVDFAPMIDSSSTYRNTDLDQSDHTRSARHPSMDGPYCRLHRAG
jgi:hypothetical protein